MAQSTFNEPGRNNRLPFPLPSQELQRTFVGITLGPLLADMLLHCVEFLSTFCGGKKWWHCATKHVPSSRGDEHLVTKVLVNLCGLLCVPRLTVSFSSWWNWKYMCFLCSNIIYPSDIVLDKHGFHRLHPLVYLPVCGKINEYTVCVLVLRKFQLC